MRIQISVNAHGELWATNSDEEPIAQRAAEILADRLDAYAREQWPQAEVIATVIDEPFQGSVVVSTDDKSVEDNIVDRASAWWNPAAEHAAYLERLLAAWHRPCICHARLPR